MCDEASLRWNTLAAASYLPVCWKEALLALWICFSLNTAAQEKVLSGALALYIALHWSYCTWKCLIQSCFNPVCTFELWIEMKSLQSWEAVEVKYWTCNCHRFLPIALLFAKFFFFLNYSLFCLLISPDTFFLCQIFLRQLLLNLFADFSR